MEYYIIRKLNVCEIEEVNGGIIPLGASIVGENLVAGFTVGVVAGTIWAYFD
jgi:lactobin A/cerein 7B family class IIb bacteriocin